MKLPSRIEMEDGTFGILNDSKTQYVGKWGKFSDKEGDPLYISVEATLDQIKHSYETLKAFNEGLKRDFNQELARVLEGEA